MTFAELSQLFVVAAPVAVVAMLNLLLALGGESGTLLLPSGKLGSRGLRLRRPVGE